MTSYALIRGGSAGISGDWRTRREAIEALARGIREHGDDEIVRHSTLVRFSGDDMQVIAENEALYDLVLRESSAASQQDQPSQPAA